MSEPITPDPPRPPGAPEVDLDIPVPEDNRDLPTGEEVDGEKPEPPD